MRGAMLLTENNEIPKDPASNALFGMITTAPDGTIISASSTFLKWIETKSDSSILGRKFDELLTAASTLDYKTEFLPRLLQQGVVDGVAMRLSLEVGTLEVVMSASVENDLNGMPASFNICVLRMQKMKNIEAKISRMEFEAIEALAAANIAFKSMLENSPFGIYAVDADFKLALVSKGAQNVFKNVNPLIGRDFAEVLRSIWPEPIVEGLIEIFRRTLKTGEPYNAPTIAERREDIDEIETYDWKVDRLTLPDGRLGIVCHFYDLSERENHETILRQSEETLKLGVSVAGLGIGTIDYLTDTISLDDAAANLFQLPSNIPIKRNLFHKRFHRDDAAGLLDEITRAQSPSSNGLLSLEHRIMLPDGAVRWVSARKQIAFENHEGTVRPISGLLVLRDITQMKDVLELLQERENLFRGTFENAAVGVAHVGLDGGWLIVNDKLCSILGYSREELTSKTFQEVTYPEDVAIDLAHVSEMLEGNIKTYSMDKRYLRKDGKLIWAGLTVSLQRGSNGEPLYFISIVRDISQRIMATESLRESRAHMHHAAQSAKLSYAVLDLEKNEVKASDNHEIVMGFVVEGIVEGASIENVTKVFLDHVVEADRHRVEETLLHELKGSIVPVIEYRVVGDDGKERWIETRSNIEAGEYGRPTKIFTTYIDITEQRRAEERIRLLMYEVNHRAKNLLAVVQAVARQTAKSGDPNTFIDRLSDRIAGLAASQDLLVLKEWKGIEIADLVRAQLSGFWDQIGTRISFAGPGVQLLPAAAQSIGMALHELATNASKYGSLSNPTGTIKLTWEILGQGRDIFFMSWIEEGGPLVIPPTSHGFGQKVIVQMIQSSLNGTAEIEYLPSGLVWRLRSPSSTTLI
jgi:PAS domain S-box-containing protein